MSQRICFFGGTFDPIHNGHLRLAGNALDECRLDQILFIPAAIPPHKTPAQLTPFNDRVAMLKAALAGRREYALSTIEGELPAPTYTVDTVRYLRRQYAPETLLFFLTGLDAFLDIATWKEYEILLRMVSFIVAEREGSDYQTRKQRLVERLGYRLNEGSWVAEDGRLPVVFLASPPLPLSSSLIRQRIREGKAIDGMVPDAVRRCIEALNLYGSRESGLLARSD